MFLIGKRHSSLNGLRGNQVVAIRSTRRISSCRPTLLTLVGNVDIPFDHRPYESNGMDHSRCFPKRRWIENVVVLVPFDEASRSGWPAERQKSAAATTINAAGSPACLVAGSKPSSGIFALSECQFLIYAGCNRGPSERCAGARSNRRRHWSATRPTTTMTGSVFVFFMPTTAAFITLRFCQSSVMAFHEVISNLLSRHAFPAFRRNIRGLRSRFSHQSLLASWLAALFWVKFGRASTSYLPLWLGPAPNGTATGDRSDSTVRT